MHGDVLLHVRSCCSAACTQMFCCMYGDVVLLEPVCPPVHVSFYRQGDVLLHVQRCCFAQACLSSSSCVFLPAWRCFAACTEALICLSLSVLQFMCLFTGMEMFCCMYRDVVLLKPICPPVHLSFYRHGVFCCLRSFFFFLVLYCLHPCHIFIELAMNAQPSQGVHAVRNVCSA